MLTDHFVEITKRRNALQYNTLRTDAEGVVLAIFDALLELIQHAADADRRIRELEHPGDRL